MAKAVGTRRKLGSRRVEPQSIDDMVASLRKKGFTVRRAAGFSGLHFEVISPKGGLHGNAFAIRRPEQFAKILAGEDRFFNPRRV